MTSFNKSDCIIPAWHSQATLKFVNDTNSGLSTRDISILNLLPRPLSSILLVIFTNWNHVPIASCRQHLVRQLQFFALNKLLSSSTYFSLLSISLSNAFYHLHFYFVCCCHFREPAYVAISAFKNLCRRFLGFAILSHLSSLSKDWIS